MNLSKEIKFLANEIVRSTASPQQGVLDLGIEVERVVAGVEMGVLENGIPYLTQRGLATMSGAARSTIQELTQEWEAMQQSGVIPPGRMAFFKDHLTRDGYDEPRLFIEIISDGSPHYAYPDIVCTAIIEHFAFEAQRTNETALRNFRNLARYGLQKFIYDALHYVRPDPWVHFQERVSLLRASAPDGHFIVFHEVSGIIVDLINAELAVNDKTIPDISVGRCWGDHWRDKGFDDEYGPRIKFDHYYPPSHPQSASNPQSAWAYPNVALAEFRRWFRHEYLPLKFPRYLLSKAHLLGGQDEALRIAGMYQPTALEKP